MLLKEEMATAARQIEIFKHEYEEMASSLQAEKRSVNVLKVSVASFTPNESDGDITFAFAKMGYIPLHGNIHNKQS